MGILGILYKILSNSLACYLKLERNYFIISDDKIISATRVKPYKHFETNLKYHDIHYYFIVDYYHSCLFNFPELSNMIYTYIYENN